MNQHRSSFGEPKTHFKMYKKGRKWLVAGVTVVGIGLGTLGVTTTSASADTTDAATTESANVDAVKTDKQATLTAGTTSDTATTENGTTSASSTTTVEAPATNTSDAAETTTTPQADEQKSAATNDQQTAPVADATTPAQSDTTTTPKQSDTTTTQSTTVTNLGDATATDVDVAKVAGKAAYEATGTPQKITAVAATTADELNYSATQNSEVHFFDRDGNEIGIGGSTGSTYSQDELNAITDILLTNSAIGERTPNQAGWTVDYANSTVNVTVDGVKTAYTLDEYFKKVLGGWPQRNG
ncbi:KxYKxGKxW signal peptide domain-containing protein [Secundilactobacillus similis]|nr:KxYKxGKxW signal peptide domain-containing protein [Secundilactobacillus similis]